MISPSPGTLSMISASSAKCAVALIMAAIAASSPASSRAICFSRRACIFRTGSGAGCSSRFCNVVCRSSRAQRALTICASFSRLASWAWPETVGESLGEPGDHLRIDGIVLGQIDRPSGQSCAPASDRRCGPRCRPRARPAPSSARSRPKPPSRPRSPCACASQAISLRRPSAVLGNICRCDNERMHASILSFATSMPTTTRSFCAIIHSLPCSVRAQSPCNCSG